MISRDEAISLSTVDLVLGGIERHAEFGSMVLLYSIVMVHSLSIKDVRPHLRLGRSRFEILLIEEDDDLLLEEDKLDLCPLVTYNPKVMRLGFGKSHTCILFAVCASNMWSQSKFGTIGGVNLWWTYIIKLIHQV